jgi:hypothetical protein
LDLGFIHTLREENVNVVGCKNLIERVMWELDHLNWENKL